MKIQLPKNWKEIAGVSELSYVKESVDHKVLSSVLWDKGWKKYWAAQDKLAKALNSYRSVSDLSAHATPEHLADLSDELSSLADKIDATIKKIK